MRKDWIHYFMDIAELTSQRATCPRLHVGCVIVKDHRIVSTGYNGSIHGQPHCEDAGCLLDEEGHCIRTIHAEMNAILHAERESLIGATAYVTDEPCANCMKTLNQAGIKNVIYKNAYPNPYNQYFIDGMAVFKLTDLEKRESIGTHSQLSEQT
jgi:dCMP deaminase